MNVIGVAITIRLHGRETGGALSVIESVDQSGSGPPLHLHHHEDETFHVLEGEFVFTCGGQSLTALPGATVFAPRGVLHTYRCIGDTPGRLMTILTPAGLEVFFEEVGALSRPQQEISRVQAIAKKYGLEFPPPDAS